jgi:hypothetical protein
MGSAGSKSGGTSVGNAAKRRSAVTSLGFPVLRSTGGVVALNSKIIAHSVHVQSASCT